MTAIETTIAFCGHAKHGKSTLAGRLLYDLGGISEVELNRQWQRAPEKIDNFSRHQKDFNRFNYIFLEHRSDTFRDKTGEPDDPSRTPFPARASVSAGESRLTLIDQPGYSRFIGNIVYGIHLSDFGVIVIDAKDSLNEDKEGKGIASGAVLAAKLLTFFEIPVIAICVSKMDEVGFSQKVFEQVKNEIQEEIVKKIIRREVPIIPAFALNETPAGGRPPELEWFAQTDLMTLVQNAQRNSPSSETGRLRCAIKEIFAPPGPGAVFLGVLETGTLHANEELVLEPASTLEQKKIGFRCRSLQPARGVNERQVRSVEVIRARALAAIATGDMNRQDAKRLLRHGGVLGREQDPPTVARRIRSQIIFFRSKNVYSGSKFKLHANASDTEAHMLIRPRQNEDTNAERELIMQAGDGEVVEAELRFDRSICIEHSEEFGRMTRFTLLDHNEVVACGRCMEVLE